jgi:Asp-tRNA(Asn)/Glu-tRNA(Gln) amidotransferase A subunit family amidase
MPMIRDDYRAIMRHQAGAVTVIACGAPGARAGLTATAVASLSDSPPTVLACVNRAAGAHDPIIEASAFSVNLLSSTQQPIAERFAYARTVTAMQVEEAKAIRMRFAAAFRSLLGAHGVLISPAVHGPAPRLDDSTAALDAYRHEAMAYLCPAGLSGLPQLVVPAGRVDGAPIGLSLIGPAGSDQQLIALAARLGL